MKRIIYTLLFLAFSISMWGQSESLFTHYMFNKLNYNPAYAGSKEVLDAGAIYRNQWWSGIDGAPKTLNVYAHLPFARLRNGAGISLIQDKIGLTKTFSLGLNYAYRIPFGKNNLAIGLNGRFENINQDWTQAETVSLTDNLINGSELANSTFNAGLGLYWTSTNYYLGLSVPRFLKNSLYQDSDEFSANVNSYYFMAGVIMPIAKNVKLYPNFMVSLNPNVPFEFDINANLLFFDAIMLGANYRYQDSIDGLVQYQFSNGLRIGVAIDFTASELAKVTTGSYEIMLGYTFPCEDCKILNLRYF
ncbi:MAG: type IX secretion system membrane protein PorP/SprF [Bacteroidetes bacterium]|jgi:type IX secretion system PorP/SprF family membrane protein|nr:type IX secretion system membrane protein PorP/SprF [Bacteroidota bacterium]MDF1867036.1 type IX secretion system membrane protein PorP/SprF [Saprospiraceae bacterium]